MPDASAQRAPRAKLKHKDIPHILYQMRPGTRALFFLIAGIAFIALIGLTTTVNRFFLVEVPSSGGSFTEGVVGRPGFINPVLALSDTDKDLSLLVYSGILRKKGNGDLIPDIGSKVVRSEDGLTYNVELKDGLTWHDKTLITADDVIFTVNRFKDPLLKSPAQASWAGVTAEKIDSRTIQFILEQPYSLFPENLTAGILPKHIWQEFTVEDFNNNPFNTNPIGSGPYKIEGIKRNRQGAVEQYDLSAFSNFALEKPFIDNIKITFYADEDELINAYKSGDIDTFGGISAHKIAATDEPIYSFPLARIFAVFLNQNEKGVFTDINVRRALSYATDKEKIINEILLGFGTQVEGPLPPQTLHRVPTTPIFDIQMGIDALIEGGWERNMDGLFEKDGEILSFSLSTGNIPELKAVAQILKEDWEKLGAQLTLRFFEIGDLNQEVIRTRRYDALLFGQVTGQTPDPFAFWHSSQRLDPGLNIALYANISVDNILEKARTISTPDERLALLENFYEEVKNDAPSVFIYSPHYIYHPAKNVQNISISPITFGSERFREIHTWFIHTDKVWKFLTNS